MSLFDERIIGCVLLFWAIVILAAGIGIGIGFAWWFWG